MCQILHNFMVNQPQKFLTTTTEREYLYIWMICTLLYWLNLCQETWTSTSQKCGSSAVTSTVERPILPTHAARHSLWEFSLTHPAMMSASDRSTDALLLTRCLVMIWQYVCSAVLAWNWNATELKCYLVMVCWSQARARLYWMKLKLTISCNLSVVIDFDLISHVLRSEITPLSGTDAKILLSFNALGPLLIT